MVSSTKEWSAHSSEYTVSDLHANLLQVASICNSHEQDTHNVSLLPRIPCPPSEEGGVTRLYSGVGPRTMWISIGGYVFFGAYEAAKEMLTSWGL